MSGTNRTVLHQYGYRINETGHEWWGFFDERYDGANSATRQQVKKKAESDIAAAAAVGVRVTATILRRDHLTTVWRRWIPGVTNEETVRL